jgi:hypothetical protein
VREPGIPARPSEIAPRGYPLARLFAGVWSQDALK